ncbi:MAG: L-seryl-tRNA(Sec) selenium transferase [Phycisphaerae bacterium]|nr:L-seryl-tRNA(Sec) selenium transferase [Phycisphaerae bacterium]
MLEEERVRRWGAEHPEALVKRAVQQAVEKWRGQILQEKVLQAPSVEQVMDEAERILLSSDQSSLRRVINATGIVLHTGLGRAPLAEEAVQAIVETARGYCNLEYDLASGERGRRVDHVTGLLCELTGAPAATVVNNNAAATLLVLRAVAQQKTASGKQLKNRHVIVSRGQLVEIGGEYRLPEIMKAAGVQLREVGTTNRTRLADYAAAIDERTCALLRVHTSNYRVQGFVEEASLAELVMLGHEHGLPVLDDLGSGALLPKGDEPVVTASVAAGADLICFSGDKLLGGPQAGIILGRQELVTAIEKSPLMRTYRLDKLVLAALEATLRLYRDRPQVEQRVLVWRMLGESREAIRRRAEKLVEQMRDLGTASVNSFAPAEACGSLRIEIKEDQSYAGGGALPTAEWPTVVVRLDAGRMKVNELARRLRCGSPAVVGRVTDGCVVLDMRTVQDEEIEPLAGQIIQSLSVRQ